MKANEKLEIIDFLKKHPEFYNELSHKENMEELCRLHDFKPEFIPHLKNCLVEINSDIREAYAKDIPFDEIQKRYELDGIYYSEDEFYGDSLLYITAAIKERCPLDGDWLNIYVLNLVTKRERISNYYNKNE
jgi:hypothetical protein